MTIEELRAAVQQAIEAIHKYDYFVGIWDSVKHDAPLDTLDEKELLRPFQDFWDQLPDCSSARRHPFYQICDLAEWYCFGVPGDEDYEGELQEVGA